MRVASLTLGGAWLLYVAAANTLLLSGFVEKQVNTDESKLRVTIGNAWTALPGRVHLSDFELRLQDRKVQMWLRIPEATTWIGLHRLVLRDLDLVGVDLRDVSFRLRWRVRPEDVGTETVRAFPSIEGLESPLAPAVTRPPEAKNTWTVRIRDADVHVAELWIQQYRRAGGMHASGDFAIRPTRWVEVPKARFELSQAPCTYGFREPLADSVEGEVELVVERHDVLQVPIEDRLSLSGWANARIADLAAFSAYVPGKRGRVSGGAGFLHVRPMIRDGLVTRGALATFQGRDVRLDLQHASIGAHASVRVSAAEPKTEAADPPTTVSLQATHVSVAADVLADRGAPLRIGEARGRLSVAPIRLSTGTRPTGGAGTLEGIDFPSIGALRLERGPVSLTRGRVRGDVQLEWMPGRPLSAEARLDLLSVQARYGRARIRAQGKLEGTVHHRAGAGQEGRVERGRLSLSSVAIEDGRGGAVRGWLNAIAGDFEYRGLRPTRLTAVVRGRFDDAEPVLNVFGIAREGLPRAARRLMSLDRLDIEGHVIKKKAGTLFRLDEAEAGDARARGVLFVNGPERRGAFFADLPLVDIGVRVRGGALDLDLFAGDRWLQEELARLKLPRM